MQTGIFHRRRFGGGLCKEAGCRLGGPQRPDHLPWLIWQDERVRRWASLCDGQEDKIASEDKSGILQIWKKPQ